MRVTNILKVDLASKQNVTAFDVVQGDTARAVEFVLFDKARPFIVPEGSLVLIRYKRADGAGGVYDTMPNGETAFVIDGNKVTVGIADLAIAVPGETDFQIAISNAGELVSAFSVAIRVQADPSADAITPENYVNIQHWLEIEIEKIKENVDDKFNQKAEELETQYSYVAEDPNSDGNVIIRPFNLGGITDVTLLKHRVPADAYATGLAIANVRRKAEGNEQNLQTIGETVETNSQKLQSISKELATKAPASGSPNYSLGMVREFEANPNSASYTTQGTLSRFYNVTVLLDSVRVLPITIDRRMLRLSDQGYDVVAAFVNDGFIYVSSVINSDNTVTFTANSVGTDYTVRILHICGYY